MKESNILLYETEEGNVNVDVILKDETIWLTQKSMAEVFDCSSDNVSLHLKNIFEDNELDKNSTTEKISVVRKEGNRNVNRELEFYNLDAIIAVGYRVNSKKATKFRIWATKILKDYMIKGFVIDTEKMKNGPKFGKDYYDELLQTIKEIRLSERRQYQKITDLFEATSIDYNKESDEAYTFFKIVQNKLHYAITGKTAAELIYERVDSEKIHMGLTTWAAAPEGKIVKSDVSVAKNYLSEKEMRSLERIVSAYLDLAEDRAERHIPMTMEDWAKRLDLFLMADDREVLQDAGKITAEIAKAKAETEFEKYRVIQDRLFMSDFDKYMLELEENAKK